MRVGFTFDLKTDHENKKDNPSDALAEFDFPETIDIVRDAVKTGGHEVVSIGYVGNLLKKLPDLGVDIVLNICEGEGGRNREAEVPALLDLYKIPYVGSDGLTLSLSLDKVMAKKAFIADRVPTAGYFVAESGFKASGALKFPLIVKPRHEGSSKGISDDSIVRDKKALENQVAYINRTYKQAAIVEEFISGQEFTVLVIGNDEPKALAPVHISILGKLDIGDLVYTSRRLEGTDISYICPPKISKALDKKLREISVMAYRSLDCRDFARVDLRVDKKGRPYVLEINPLPSLSTEDVFPLIAKEEGMTYEELILKIIDIAAERCGVGQNGGQAA
ncbi:MAG TPA: ATP-grasp domain-containing protein [Candidatus Omnitrophota bacterium]|nr:ATP-grasp domain-containing protein [Candidatus Omnitrophota bacterium]